jgi:transaldolase/glucose-6-phosphate isomerase
MYGQDRLFVYVRQDGSLDADVEALRSAGQPAIGCSISSLHDLGAEIYRWEYATAIACHLLGVNAFDQPDVQDSKSRTRDKLIQLAETGNLPMPPPLLERDGVMLATNLLTECSRFSDAFSAFVDEAKASAYVGVNAYVPRIDTILAVVEQLRAQVASRTGGAVTLGIGPRFLHSTGQLQKGGPRKAAFLQLTCGPTHDINVPTQQLTFGQMESAQAAGDFEALLARGRRVLWIHVPNEARLRGLLELLE